MPSSGEYLRIESVGRRTGRRHGVLVRFITVDGKIVVFPQNKGNQDWLANVRENPGVSVFWAGKAIQGNARVRNVSGLKDPLLTYAISARR